MKVNSSILYLKLDEKNKTKQQTTNKQTNKQTNKKQRLNGGERRQRLMSTSVLAIICNTIDL